MLNLVSVEKEKDLVMAVVDQAAMVSALNVEVQVTGKYAFSQIYSQLIRSSQWIQISINQFIRKSFFDRF